MKKNYCKIVFSDIDGTILTSDGVVTPGTKEMILEMEKDGIPFVLTSARSPEGVRVIKRKIGNHAPMICFCGALILDQDERPLYSCQIPLDTAVELKHLLEKEFPEVCCNTFGFEKWIVDNREDAREQREEAIVGFSAEIGSIEKVFAEDGGIHKFLLMGEPEQMKRLAVRLREAFPNLQVAASNAEYLEVTENGVKKSVALEALCEKLGLTAEQAGAFGDGESDMGMIATAKFGYAMGSAPEEVRKSAKFVTSKNDEEGVLAGLREIFG